MPLKCLQLLKVLALVDMVRKWLPLQSVVIQIIELSVARPPACLCWQKREQTTGNLVAVRSSLFPMFTDLSNVLYKQTFKRQFGLPFLWLVIDRSALFWSPHYLNDTASLSYSLWHTHTQTHLGIFRQCCANQYNLKELKCYPLSKYVFCQYLYFYIHDIPQSNFMWMSQKCLVKLVEWQDRLLMFSLCCLSSVTVSVEYGHVIHGSKINK